MPVLQESNFSSGGDQEGIKQLLLKMTGPVLGKRQFALCFPVAYSTLFKVFQSKETNNNSIIVGVCLSVPLLPLMKPGAFVPP